MFYNLRRLNVILIALFIAAIAVSKGGCGSWNNTAASYDSGYTSDASGKGALTVNCPFTATQKLSKDICRDLQYYTVNVYAQNSTTPLAPAQRVDKPSNGSTGTAQFIDLPLGYVTVSAKGYTGTSLLNCESSSDVQIKGPLPSEIAVKPLHGPVPDGFSIKEMTFEAGSGTFSMDSFGALNEAIISVNYNSENPDMSTANMIEAAGMATNQESSGPVLNACNSRTMLPEGGDIQALDDMEFVTRKMAEGVEKYGIPGPVSREWLMKQGRMDKNGRYVRDTIGQKRSIILWKRADTSSVSREYITRSCTCCYSGERCVIYVDDADWSVNIEQGRVDAIGQYTDTMIWPKAEELFGRLPELRWGDRLFVIFSSQIAHGAYFDADNEYDSSEVPHSNQLDCVFCDPSLSKETYHATTRDFQGVVAHEFQHLLRWYRKVYQSGYVHYDAQQLKDSLQLDSPVTEGFSQYFECMVDRGFFNGDDLSKVYRLKTLRSYLSKPQNTSMVYGSIDGYAAGFLMVFYLYDHYGMEGLQRASLADGNLALRSLETASGETATNLFAKFSLALKLADVPGINSEYSFKSIDLSGATRYYQDQGLYTAWSCFSNCNDYSLGVDLREGSYIYYLGGLKPIEWSPMYMRFFNGSGNPLKISLTGFQPTTGGGGSFTVYVLSR